MAIGVFEAFLEGAAVDFATPQGHRWILGGLGSMDASDPFGPGIQLVD
ncbi:MAG: hypothetical protein K0U63_02835 [Cyanobacteria bacterium]|nr:hypothetical protein [Cyanobacteriota bacterium]